MLAALILALTFAVAGCGNSGPTQPPAPKRTVPGEVGASVVRITGRSTTDVADAAILSLHPPGRTPGPSGWVVVNRDDWRAATLGAQFVGHPINAALVPISKLFLPTGAKDLMARVTPSSFPLAKGIQTLLIGGVSQDVLGDLTALNLKIAQLKDAPAPDLAATLVPYRGGFAHVFASEVVVISAQARDYALPAGAWSAYSGDTIAYVNRNSVPAATRALLVQREKLRAEKPTIYVIGPQSVVSQQVAGELSAYGTVRRVAGRDAVGTAVALARYRDPQTGFGWGLAHGPANVGLVNLHHWGDAIGAFNFAGAGPQAPLLLTDRADSLPPAVSSYLTSLGGSPSNQGFVFGGPGSITSGTLKAFDAALLGSYAHP